MSCEICLLEGKFNFGQRWRIKHLNHIFSTDMIGKLFLTINRPRSSKNSFYDTSFFLKISLIEKNLEIDLLNEFFLFFESCLSLVFFNRLFIFSSNICAIKEWFTSTFFKEKLFHWFCNKKSIFSSLEFLDLFQLLDFDNRVCNALFVRLPNQLLHCHLHNKNSNINKFSHVVFRFPLSMQFFQVSLHYFFIAIF